MGDLQRIALTSDQHSDAPPIACALAAMDDQQLSRYEELRAQIESAVQEVAELPDGYGLRLADDAATILATAEFITLERLCCPFLKFDLEVGPQGGTVWLRLTGREGVKDFLKGEFLRG